MKWNNLTTYFQMRFPVWRGYLSRLEGFPRSAGLAGVAAGMIALSALEFGLPRSIYIVGGTFLILFLPGWWISFIAFPASEQSREETALESQRTLDLGERLTLAVALSIVISSALTFLLYALPGESRLNPKNFAITLILTNTLLFANAIWRERWFHPIYAAALVIFSCTVVMLNLLFGVAVTIPRFIGETLILGLVMIAIKLARWKMQ